ncbi:serine O-acetyltransferase [Caulobacter sp. BP25]|uniref:serine O-acetyltransferase n=1 Tax=Caulobacter sp. BP25 TaxID=2048900 RepID=UPI00351730FE
MRTFLLTPGLHFIAAHRLVGLVRKVPIIGRPLSSITWVLTCNIFRCEVALGTQLGPAAYIPHPYGIVVGDATIGRNVTILQNVTIGTASRSRRDTPIIGDDVFIGAGAVIIGAVKIGPGASIGANAVVVKDVPAGASAIGVPARVKE